MQPIRVRTGSEDREGRLVLIDGELAAVLVRLDDDMHEQDRGKWFLEAEFSRLSRPTPFVSLDEAQHWLWQHARA